MPVHGYYENFSDLQTSKINYPALEDRKYDKTLIKNRFRLQKN